MRSPIAELGAFFRAALVDRVEDDETQATDSAGSASRRRIVVAATIVVGAVALRTALSIRPGETIFYLATLGLAMVWVTGAFASGPIRRGRARRRDGGTSRSVLQGFVLGLMLLSVFLAGAIVVARTNLPIDSVEQLLDHARFGSLTAVLIITALNGIAEEIFFRGAVFSAFPQRWQIPGSVAVYAASTALSGVPLLTLAAACLGVVTGLQRRVTGGVLGAITSHLTWSIGMLLLLPGAIRLGAG